MLRTIEKYGDVVIQKVYSNSGDVIAYQAGIPGDVKTITRCSSLAEARDAIGVHINPPQSVTKPKMANPQNQKGYRADRR